MRKIVWISGATLICLVAAVLVVPHFIDLGIFKRSYLPLVEEILRRRIDVGEVRLSLVPTPSIRLSNLKVSDSSAFPGNTFFAAEQLQLRLKFWPLLRGRFEVTEFVVEKPIVNLLKRPDGTLNYSDFADKKGSFDRTREGKKRADASKPQESAAMPLIVPSRLRVRDGQLNFQTPGQKAVEINGIDLSLQEFSGDRPFPYRASFSFPGLKPIALEGMLNYQEDQSTLWLNGTRLRVQDLVLPVEGNISNLSTVPSVNLSLGGDHVDAKPIFQILSAVALVPSHTEVSGPMALRIAMTGPLHSLVTQVRGQFKGVKVLGKRALKGTFSGEVFIRLPPGGVASTARRLQGNGNLVARGGELTNVDVINRVQRVAGLIGLSPNERRQATTFKTLEATFVVADGFADFKRIYLINPQIEMSGGGTMTLERPSLNLAMEAVLSAQASARAAKGKTAAFLKDSQGRMVVPLKITGPLENPSVELDSSKMLQRGSGQVVEKGLGTFFKQLFRER
ncbi:MAG TPA: AsmA family protein [Candidatus Binatia bacterium]|nr:AsmA family protein [Candidatus Binatia bacterium]